MNVYFPLPINGYQAVNRMQQAESGVLVSNLYVTLYPRELSGAGAGTILLRILVWYVHRP